MSVMIALTERRARAVAFALLARSLGPDPGVLRDEEHLAALLDALAGGACGRAVAAFDGFDPRALPDESELAGRWVRWFDLGRVAPYEGSNVAASAGGITPRLADVAGYYRAFGVRVEHERPDHVVAELEFLALALAMEADAVEQHHDEQADVVADAVRSFVRDHAGTWIDAWACRLGEVDALSPWAPFALAAAELVRAEAAARNVVPARTAPVLVADAGVADDADGALDCE